MIEKIKSKPLARFLTGLKIIGKALLLLPIPAAMAFMNYTVDVSGIFHGEQFEKDIALAMLGGKAVDNYDRMNERGVLGQMVESMEEPFDTLAFGSSRVLQLRDSIVDDSSYFNCGVSAGDLVDMLGLYYEFDRAGMQPKTVILELDPWLLSRRSYDRQPKSDKNLYNEFLYEKLGYDVSYEPGKVDNSAKVEALFSPTYLQGNLQAYLGGGEEYTPPAVVEGNLQEHPTNIKLPDGSVLYMSSFRDAPPDAVQERVLNHAIEFMWMEDFYEVDEELCTLFGRFVQYLQDQNIEVIFLLTPYHPVVYNNAMEYPDIYAGFFQTEPFFTSYAKKHDIPVYGSYNPFVAGTLDDDFFDGLHIKPEALAKLFPGVQEVQRLQQAGREACSPWLRSRAPVEQTVAVQIVRQRYEIPQAEELRRDADEWIEGSACYVFGRYAPPEEGKPAQSGDEEEEWRLLARYAVSKDQGMIYRYDTDQEQWLVDRRGLRG